MNYIKMREEMSDYLSEYENALFKAAIFELAIDESTEILDFIHFNDNNLSELLDKRIEKLIYDKLHRNETKKLRKHLIKIIARVTIIFMVIITVSFISIISVEALRSNFINFLMTFAPQYTEIQLQEEELVGNIITGGQSIKFNNQFIPTYIPSSFVIKSISVNDVETEILYVGSNDRYINFMVFSKDNITKVDTENADKIETINIGINNGILIEKDGLLKVSWADGGYYFILLGNIDKDEAIKIAQSVKLIK